MIWLRWIGLSVALLLPAACGDGDDEDEAVCGSATCASNQYCCDRACGLCVEEGVACTNGCP